MPARADIDPLDVPPILPNIVLVDVTGDPPRFRFRVVGTDIVFRYGAELTGRDLEQVDLGTELGSVRSQYEETTRERVPTYCRHQIETGGGKLLRYERLLLPLAAGGTHVDMLLGVSTPFRAIFPSSGRSRRRCDSRRRKLSRM